MKLVGCISSLTGAALALESATTLFENEGYSHRIPTSYESAVMGRRILALTKLATLSTVFPDASPHAGTRENRPTGLDGLPIGLMDYIGDCEEQGNPTVLAIQIGTTFKNVRAGSNITISLQWTPPYPPAKRISMLSRIASYIPFIGESFSANKTPDTVPYSAANLPRFSLIGYLESIHPDEETSKHLAKCYTSKHPDSKYWLPGNRIHKSEWVRMVVNHVYWIGGFGDRAYIGWIPTDEWKNVTRAEWEDIKLPGETKDWNEWNADESVEL